MSSPPVKYLRYFDFTTFATLNPEKPLPGGSVDVEYNRLKSTTDQIIDRLALIQRDDGALKNGIVTVPSLGQDTLDLIVGVGNPRGQWLTGTYYVVKDLVSQNAVVYICVVDHLATDFAADLAAGKWMIFSGGVNLSINLWSRGPVLDILAVPPSTPAANDRYLVAHTGTTGIWVGLEDQCAEFMNGAWVFSGPPVAFQSLFVVSKHANYGFLNGAWQPAKAEGSMEDFGVDGTGATDVTATFVAALAQFNILTLSKTYQIGDLAMPAGKTLTGSGKLVSKTGASALVNMGDDCRISGLRIDNSTNTYGLAIGGKRCKVLRNFFSGTATQHITVGGDYADVSDNDFDGRVPNTILNNCAVFGGCKYYRFSRNNCYEPGGFAVQTRLGAYNGIISDNMFHQPIYSDSKVATAGQTVFAFTLTAADCIRFGIQIDGLPWSQQGGSWTISHTTGLVYTVTLSVGATAGATIKLVAWRGLENVNINSNTYGLTVANNTIDGTGDSGIVVGCDYHNGVLDPSHIAAADYSHRITICGNVVKNALGAGIAVIHPAPASTVCNNVISDCGQGINDLNFNSAITITGTDIQVVGNSCENTLVPSVMPYGISLNAYNSDATGDSDKAMKVGLNSFAGSFSKKYMVLNASSGGRRQNLEFIGGCWLRYPADIYLDDTWNNVPTGTPYFSWSHSGAGLVRDGAVKLGGVNSMYCNAADATDCGLSAAIFRDFDIFVMDFMANAADASSIAYVQIFTDLGGLVPVQCNVNKIGWNHYTITVPIQGTTLQMVRFQGGTGKVNFQHIQFRALRMP